jgi:hypothetical protein
MVGTMVEEEYLEWLETNERGHSSMADYIREPSEGYFTDFFTRGLFTHHHHDDVELPDEIDPAILLPWDYLRCYALIVWLKKAFLHHWDGSSGIIPGSISATSLAMMEYAKLSLFKGSFENEEREGIAMRETLPSIFGIPSITKSFDAFELARSYLGSQGSATHILDFEAPFKVEEKALCFRTLNYLYMKDAVAEAQMIHDLRAVSVSRSLELQPSLQHLEHQYLLLNVRREDALRDAFDQLWQRDRLELFRPLRVRLGQMDGFEIAHDLGGVQTEFFNLVCKQLFDGTLDMFTTNSTTGLSYFRPGCLQPLYMFELVGILFGLALYNGIPLPVSFPTAFYNNLLDRKDYELHQIRDGWPEYYRSLNAIKHGEVDDLDFVLPIEANGLRLSVVFDGERTNEERMLVVEVVEATRIEHHDRLSASTEASADIEQQASNLDLRLDFEALSTAWPGWRLRNAGTEPDEVTDNGW